MVSGAQVDGRPADARFDIVRRGEWTVVTVTGEVDLTVTDVLDAHLDTAVEQGDPPLVVVELTGMGFCDSSGLNSLIRAVKQIKAAGGRMVLLGPSERFRQVLETTGLGRVFEVSTDPPY